MAAMSDNARQTKIVPPYVPIGQSDYMACYTPLYELMKANRLDFGKVAQETGFRERRVREALQYRLGCGEVRQLFGHKPSFCYLCTEPVDRPQEPVCYPCLRTIYRVCIEDDDKTPAPPKFGFERPRREPEG